MMLQTSSCDGDGVSDSAAGLSNGIDHDNVAAATSSQNVVNNVDGFNSSTTVTAAVLVI